jgi:hypothetical protein
MKSRWWRELVFNAVYVRGFFHSDGDGTGDSRRAAEKLATAVRRTSDVPAGARTALAAMAQP